MFFKSIKGKCLLVMTNKTINFRCCICNSGLDKLLAQGPNSEVDLDPGSG